MTSTTAFWLIRHAIVAEDARAMLYGTLDVPLCPHSLVAQMPVHRALAHILPQDAQWLATPLSRTRLTAEAIFAAGYPACPITTEPGLIEQDLGEWQGLSHAALPPRLLVPAHRFWPLSGQERPPGGESMADVIARIGPCLDRLADDHVGQDIVAVSHGGAIRGAVAHALGLSADQALHFSIANLSLTRLMRTHGEWQVVCVNECTEHHHPD